MEELKGMEGRLPWFTFVPVLSREPEDSPWKGARGRVTDLLRERIPRRADLDVYICGRSEMVESCLALLEEKDIPAGRIYYDKFT